MNLLKIKKGDFMNIQFSSFLTKSIVALCILTGINSYAMEIPNPVELKITNNTPSDIYYKGTEKIASGDTASFDTSISGTSAIYHIVANAAGQRLPMQIRLKEVAVSLKTTALQAALVQGLNTFIARSAQLPKSIPGIEYLISLVINGTAANNFAGSTIALEEKIR